MRDQFNRVSIENAIGNQPLRKLDDVIALGFGCALRFGLVQFVVVGKRVRIWANATMRVDQYRRSMSAAIIDSFRHGGEGFEKIETVAAQNLEVRKTKDETRDTAAGGLFLH